LCLEYSRVAHLLHEQRNVLEDVAVIQSEASAENMASGAGQIVSEANARAEVAIVIAGLFISELPGEWADIGDCNQLLVRAAVADGRSTDEVEIEVPTETEIQCQTPTHFPVVLEVRSELLSAAWNVGCRIAI